MPTFKSDFLNSKALASLGDPKATTDANRVYPGSRPGVFVVKALNGLAVNDIIELCDAEPGLQVVPEQSRVRSSGTAGAFTATLQHVAKDGTTITNLTAALAITGATVQPFVAANAQRLPVAPGGGKYRLLVSAVATPPVAATEFDFEIELRRTTGV